MEETYNEFLRACEGQRYQTVVADPPWQFQNRTGKIAPEHKRLSRYPTMKLEDIMNMPVKEVTAEKAHLYLWCPNALIPEGLEVLRAWGLNTRRCLHGKRLEKMACRTDEVLDFILEM